MTRTAHIFDRPRPEHLSLLAGAVPDRPTPSDAPLWLYGCGHFGELAGRFFAHIGVPVAGVFEHSQDIVPRGARIAVCIVTAPYVPIERSLRARGFRDVWPGYDVLDLYRGRGHPLADNGWCAPPLTLDDEATLALVLSAWHDETSRAHYLQFLAWRIAREEWTFECAPPPVLAEQHFLPEVCAVLGPDEVFLDGGSCTWTATVKFANAVGSRFARIEAFEPDPANKDPIWGWGGRTRHHPIALSDHTGWAPFYGGFGVASRLGPDGREKVPTARLDDLGIEPTFIKLHLEGGELAALRGAERTIRECRPIIAANVDHNEDGIWRTANHLMSTLVDYRFLFRNHVWCAAGSVIYAIPEERAA